MTSFDVYIGDLEGPDFKLKGGNWSGNFPQQLGPTFPPSSGMAPMDIYLKVHALAESGKYPSEQTDWGCWVVIMTRNELLKYIDRLYGDGPIQVFDLTIKEGETREDHDIRLFVQSLDPIKRFGLVALES
jgi:hypothetical protein